MKKDAIAVIPARLGSERLPGKPLRLLGGRPLIERVYHAAKSTSLFREIFVLTDSEEIRKCVESFGGGSLLTSVECSSGTDRILEVRERLTGGVIVNIQGDEPFIDKESLQSLLAAFDEEEVEIASLMHREDDPEKLNNPNIVKVVVDLSSYSLYFSRSQIPYFRSKEKLGKISCYRHIGVYAFRKRILDSLADLTPGALEKIERLEQLRWLENGYRIKMVNTYYDGFGIDTEADLSKAELRYRSMKR